jgi:Transglycosylase SLT domain
VLARARIPALGRWSAPILALAMAFAGQALAGPVDELCGVLANQAERTQGIPRGLVHAVALAESGRWLAEERTTRPWPWTVTSGSESFYLPSRAAALRKIEELRAEGRSNIDVGCMQVNLGFHGDAFASDAEALEPARNVAYAARFLKQLQAETRSWEQATAHYHSRQPARGRAYREKVFRWWRALLDRPKVERPEIRVAGASSTAAEGAAAPAPTDRERLIVPGRQQGARPAAPRNLLVLRGN